MMKTDSALNFAFHMTRLQHGDWKMIPITKVHRRNDELNIVNLLGRGLAQRVLFGNTVSLTVSDCPSPGSAPRDSSIMQWIHPESVSFGPYCADNVFDTLKLTPNNADRTARSMRIFGLTKRTTEYPGYPRWCR